MSKKDAEKKEAEDKQEIQDPKDAKIEELTNDLKRVQAEFENFKKRSEKENQRYCEYAKADVIKRFLTVLDSFEIALKNTDNHEEFVNGVELIYSQLYNTLKELGVRPIETKDKKLNTDFHDVMLSEKSDKEEDMILEELQKGYLMGELVLRHSKVKVAKR